jgi:serine/threonine protein kinase
MKPEDIFCEAVAKESAERAAFLDAACAQDTVLRARVEGLLKAHANVGSFLEQPLFESVSESEAKPAEAGAVIGPYKLIKQIGQGGMGTVFLAEQSHPVQRQVALKIIKQGMDSRQVVARFEAERQALALMDHPNIAKVLDAGQIKSPEMQKAKTQNTCDLSLEACDLSTGRPYFVMEVVNGVPLTKFCDDARLRVRERLELFIPVCLAVQHAHQKGIIHRDLKPSNILVCSYDGRPVPKVIDFGLAKATRDTLSLIGQTTAHGLVLGTPLYMSPEQAELNNLDIDTRADIYALGVILYELLTGTTPLEQQEHRAWPELLRSIKEEEAPKPSARISDLGKTRCRTGIRAPRHRAAKRRPLSRTPRIPRGRRNPPGQRE